MFMSCESVTAGSVAPADIRMNGELCRCDTSGTLCAWDRLCIVVCSSAGRSHKTCCSQRRGLQKNNSSALPCLALPLLFWIAAFAFCWLGCEQCTFQAGTPYQRWHLKYVRLTHFAKLLDFPWTASLSGRVRSWIFWAVLVFTFFLCRMFRKLIMDDAA